MPTVSLQEASKTVIDQTTKTAIHVTTHLVKKDFYTELVSIL
jgi:hypothetical protein